MRRVVDGTVVHEDDGDAAAGDRLRLRPGGREGEVLDGQAHRPAVVGVRLHLYADLGGVVLVHLAVVPPLLIGVVEDLAHR